MSFGYSVGDFLLCIQLAQKVLKEYQEAPEEFQAASADVVGLKIVLNDIKDAVQGCEMSRDKQRDLQKLLSGCDKTLKELLQVLERFNSLATSSHLRWEKFRWDKDRVERIRLRIVSTVGLLTAFRLGILSASQDRIEKLLQQLIQQPQSSTVSGKTLESAARGNSEAWWQLGARFEAFGISPTMVLAHRHFISAWIILELGNFQSCENTIESSETSEYSFGLVPSERTRAERLAAGELLSSKMSGVDSLEPSSNPIDTASAFHRYAKMPIRRSPALRRPRKLSDAYNTVSDTNSPFALSMDSSGPRKEALRRWTVTTFNDSEHREHFHLDKRKLRRNSLWSTESDSSSVQTVVHARSNRENHRRYTFTDPPRTRYREAGITNLEACLPNPLLNGPETDQLQLYLLGIAVDALASSAYVIHRAPSQKVITGLSRALTARYKCKHPRCDAKWRTASDHKKHQAQHPTPFHCQQPVCEGKANARFSSNVDLVRHLQSVHGHTQNGDFRGFACAADFCARKDKVWLKEDNYRAHCSIMHHEENCDNLVKKSRIYVLQPSKRS